MAFNTKFQDKRSSIGREPLVQARSREVYFRRNVSERPKKKMIKM